MSRKLFIDPGTNSSGWALFIDGKLAESGTVTAEGNTLERLHQVANKYSAVAQHTQPDFVYFERMNRIVNVACIWFVGAVAVAIREGWMPATPLLDYDSQISPSMWKKYEKAHTMFSKLRDSTLSNDEAIAILIGLAYYEYKESTYVV